MRAAIAATIIAIGLALPAFTFSWAGESQVPEPEGYRSENYRAPVPSTLAGARVLTTAEAAAIWKSGAAAFVDVLPQAPRPQNLPAGTLWHEKPHLDIPGSIWLPDTGYGALHPTMEQYFRSNLDRVGRSKLLVFYCLSDCWMSWNAAKRAQDFGYRNVAWYPEGTDGWSAAGLPLEEKRPEPRPGA